MRSFILCVILTLISFQAATTMTTNPATETVLDVTNPYSISHTTVLDASNTHSNSHTTGVHHTTHTTRHHTPTHEPDEHEMFTFHYEHNTHQMLIKLGRNCHIFMLSSQERTQVHTSTGLRALELKLLALFNFATKTLLEPNAVNVHVRQSCGTNTQNYYMMS